MKAYISKLDLFMDPTSIDIFYLAEQKMRSPTSRWFFCNFQYPSHSFQDVVANFQSRCLDARSPVVVVRNYYKDSCILQCKFHRAHQGKFLPLDSLYDEEVRSTCFIDNRNCCSCGTSDKKVNRKSSINRMTDTSS